MRITILAVGTRGDVQPYVALGLGLRAAGHAVRIAAASNFESFVCERGLEYVRLEANFRDIMGGDAARQLGMRRNPVLAYREMMGLLRHVLERFTADSWTACQGADAIVFSTIAVCGYSIAEKLGVPSCWAPLQPISRTREFPSAIVPIPHGWSGTLNWLTYLFEEQVGWQSSRRFVNEWRHGLGLDPFPFFGPNALVERAHYPVVYGYSPVVLPRPRDWGEWIHVTGYWFLDRGTEWRPPLRLVDFLSSGEPPVYVGFGSMNSRTPQEQTRVIVDALALTRRRAILAAGWGSLADMHLPDTILAVDEVPHDWLFPQVAAVVHHGGAGTTAAALRAGVPSVVVPHIVDQHFWARRLFDLGVGTRPLPRRCLTAPLLAEAILAAMDDGLRARARALSARICAEDGVRRAVEVMSQCLSSR